MLCSLWGMNRMYVYIVRGGVPRLTQQHIWSWKSSTTRRTDWPSVRPSLRDSDLISGSGIGIGLSPSACVFPCHHPTIAPYSFIDCVDKKNQLDVTLCILYFSSNSCSTCFGQPCANHQELTTAWCYSLVLVCAVAAGRWSSPVGS